MGPAKNKKKVDFETNNIPEVAVSETFGISKPKCNPNIVILTDCLKTLGNGPPPSSLPAPSRSLDLHSSLPHSFTPPKNPDGTFAFEQTPQTTICPKAKGKKTTQTSLQDFLSEEITPHNRSSSIVQRSTKHTLDAEITHMFQNILPHQSPPSTEYTAVDTPPADLDTNTQTNSINHEYTEKRVDARKTLRVGERLQTITKKRDGEHTEGQSSYRTMMGIEIELPPGVQYFDEHTGFDGLPEVPLQLPNLEARKPEVIEAQPPTVTPEAANATPGVPGKGQVSGKKGWQVVGTPPGNAASPQKDTQKRIDLLAKNAHQFAPPLTKPSLWKKPDNRPDVRNQFVLSFSSLSLITKMVAQIVPDFDSFDAEFFSNNFSRIGSTIPYDIMGRDSFHANSFFSFPALHGGTRGSATTDEINSFFLGKLSEIKFKYGVVVVPASKTILFSDPEAALRHQGSLGGDRIVHTLTPRATSFTTLAPVEVIELHAITGAQTVRKLNLTVFVLLPPSLTHSPPAHKYVECVRDTLYPHTPPQLTQTDKDTILFFGPLRGVNALKSTLSEIGINPLRTHGTGDDVFHAVVMTNTDTNSNEIYKTLQELGREHLVNVIFRKDLKVEEHEEIITIHSATKGVKSLNILNDFSEALKPLKIKLFIPTGQRVLAIRDKNAHISPEEIDVFNANSLLIHNAEGRLFSSRVVSQTTKARMSPTSTHYLPSYLICNIPLSVSAETADAVVKPLITCPDVHVSPFNFVASPFTWSLEVLPKGGRSQAVWTESAETELKKLGANIRLIVPLPPNITTPPPWEKKSQPSNTPSPPTNTSQSPTPTTTPPASATTTCTDIPHIPTLADTHPTNPNTVIDTTILPLITLSDDMKF